MSESTVAIVGTGIIGTTFAYLLSKKGYDVVIFEKGPEYPYPHVSQHKEKIRYLYDNPAYRLPKDLKNLTYSGIYSRADREREMVVGGMAIRWEAITLRMTPNDFRTRSLYGYGENWPLTYSDLEPYYCTAEELMGVSGKDSDNPFAPERSKPYPLPSFELGYYDKIFAEMLREHGIVLHTTPQARTRVPYGDRSACVNIGTCFVCPIGARYSPNYHLQKAVQSGLCKVLTNVTVKRIITDKSLEAKTLVYQHNDSRVEKEHHAKVFIVANGAIESARLLLLSADERNPNGIGNESGNVGKNLTFHHMWGGNLKYKEPVYPGRFGGLTGQSHQFLDPPDRGKHGGIKVEFSSNVLAYRRKGSIEQRKGSEIVEYMRLMPHWRRIHLTAESIPDPKKYVKLSDKKDRFGDLFAHVHYESSDFDYESYRFCTDIFKKFAFATKATEAKLGEVDDFDSASHHMGACCMGNDKRKSVVDQFSKIHDSSNLFVAGSGNFPGTSGAINPTLTAVAMAIRIVDYILDQLL